jgi:hypothetical protein
MLEDSMVGPIATAVTGREDPVDPQEPIGALVEFYRAFNTRDIALMERKWDSSDEASMDNPLGGIRRGWAEIRQVYERIFNGAATLNVEFHDYTLHRFSEIFYAVGRERGTLKADNLSLDQNIRTTRLFRLTGADGARFTAIARLKTPAFCPATRWRCAEIGDRQIRCVLSDSYLKCARWSFGFLCMWGYNGDRTYFFYSEARCDAAKSDRGDQRHD